MIPHSSDHLLSFSDDPREKHDISTDMPELTELLLEKLRKYIAEESYPLWPDAVSREVFNQNGHHGPGWCTLEQLLEQRLKGLSNIKQSMDDKRLS